jgi:hypothetical protein
MCGNNGWSNAIYGTAQTAQAVGNRETAQRRQDEFLTGWKNADPDRPETAAAKKFLEAK